MVFIGLLGSSKKRFGLGSRGTVRILDKTCSTLEYLIICQLFTVLLLLDNSRLMRVNGYPAEEVLMRSDDSKSQPLQQMQLPHGTPHRYSGQGQETRVEIPMPRLLAVERLLEKYKQMEEHEREEEQEATGSKASYERMANPRALWSDDFGKKASELCGTSASLRCGKRILAVIEGQEQELSVHRKCDLRDDFLECIDIEKRGCLELAESSILPELPPKEAIKLEQSKLWKILWTAGGCVLANY